MGVDMKFNPKSIYFSIFILVALAAIFACLPTNKVLAQYYYGYCTNHSYQQCNGNYLYWYDSCGHQQDSQYCPGGCYNNYCQNNNYNNYGNCTNHAYQLCSGNSIYWFSSCGAQQDFVQSCSGTNIVCKYGQCVYQPPVVVNPPIVYGTYVAHQKLGCYSNSVYWYDTLGNVNSLYKNCSDANSCTLDRCATGKCSNVLKCDGSTCAVDSTDYNNYCLNNVNPTPTVKPSAGGLSVLFFEKQDQSSTQWQKSAQVGPNGKIYFMMSVVNNSATQIENVSVSANIPSEISSLGNLQINGVSISGDIISGVNIGSLAVGNSKSVTFEGRSGSILLPSAKKAVATVSAVGYSSQTDSVALTLSIVPSTSSAAVSSTVANSFWDFLKRWYLWILVGLVLIFLFIIVFRRLSSNS